MTLPFYVIERLVRDDQWVKWLTFPEDNTHNRFDLAEAKKGLKKLRGAGIAAQVKQVSEKVLYPYQQLRMLRKAAADTDSALRDGKVYYAVVVDGKVCAKGTCSKAIPLEEGDYEMLKS